MLLITSIIVIVFAVLQIVLFFKVWGMTNNVKSMKEELCTPKTAVSKNWEKEFALFVATNKKDKAKEILYSEVLNSSTFSNIVKAGNDSYRDSCIKELNEKYAIYLKEIGEESVSIDFGKDIYKAFK